MFEPESRGPSKRWIYLPLGGVILVGIVGFIIVMARPDPRLLAPLENVLHAGDSDYEWYSKYVTLENQSIKMAKSFAGKRLVIFTGVISNGGERTLDAVEIKLVLFNQGDPVFDVVKAPIRPGPYTPPIGSLSSRAFTVYLDEFPKNWLASRAEMELIGFRFVSQDEISPQP